MTPAIEVDHVTVARGPLRVLDGVCLSVNAGEVTALAGPSGGGKTTLLRVLLGLDLPASGTVRLRGRIATDGAHLIVPPEQRKLAMVFQDLALWPHLTVSGNLAFGLDTRGVSIAAREQKIHHALRLVGLADCAERIPGELSGGERQRVAMARALVADPDAILLDEPLSNLDIALKRELIELLRRLLRQKPITAVYVTHDPREAGLLADRIAILEKGAITQIGTAQELSARPATEFARIFAAEMCSSQSTKNEG